jgi:hypothetical protein
MNRNQWQSGLVYKAFSTLKCPARFLLYCLQVYNSLSQNKPALDWFYQSILLIRCGSLSLPGICAVIPDQPQYQKRYFLRNQFFSVGIVFGFVSLSVCVKNNQLVRFHPSVV